MPPKRLAPTDPKEWLRRARSNLARAKNDIPEACLEDLCFDAQQAAEKAIKAVFIHRTLAFPFTHDLARLVKTARGRRQGPEIRWSREGLDAIRYRNALSRIIQAGDPKGVAGERPIAQAVLHWAEREVAK